MLRSASCHLLGLKQLETIHSTLKSAIKMERHTQLTRKKSAFYTTLRGSKTACQIQRNVQCFRLDGKSNCNLLTKKTHFSRCRVCKQWWSREEFLGLGHFVQSLDGIQLIGTNFLSVAGLGKAWRGSARRGLAGLGMANTLPLLWRRQQFGAARPGKARLGAAGPGGAGLGSAGCGGVRHGAAGLGEARLGMARHGKHTASSAEGVAVWRGGAGHGSAGQGKARLGRARQGLAGLGMANTLPFLRKGQQFEMARQGPARPGKARPGMARHGWARHGMAWQTHCLFYRGGSSLAGQGWAGQGGAGRG